MICLEVVYPGAGTEGRTVIVPGGLFAEGVYNGGPNKKAPLRRGFGFRWLWLRDAGRFPVPER